MTSPTHGPIYWEATCTPPSFPALAGDLEVDVAVIGGGIVGIAAARALKDAGLTVAVVEARRVGQGVSGKATAKVTSQHGIKYRQLVQSFGEEAARLYAEAQEAGLRQIVELPRTYGFEADVETMPAFVYTCQQQHVQEIEDEVVVARRLGLPASLATDTGLPFAVEAAMRWDDQAQFHPLKFVAGLAATIPGEGCHVFENSRVTDWDPHRIATAGGSVRARDVVMATNLPLGQVGLYYTISQPMAEPVIAAPIGKAPPGYYKSVEQPGRSLRTHKHDGRTYAVCAGSHYKPGQADDERKGFAEIEGWLRDHFAPGDIEYRWVNEDYSSVDGAPFVGWSSSLGDGYLVATGFAAWGFTNGMAAGTLIADLVQGRHNPWLKVFDATRVKPIAAAKDFLKGNLEVAGHLIGGYAKAKPHSYDDLAPGDAAILKVDGENVAAFRDKAGAVHSVSAACTHMGCILGWNANDRTWDCPCHGSRFALGGEVIAGPAVEPLERMAG